MVIVAAIGGLGNQLFQYSFYKKQLSLGKDAYMDLSYFDNKENHLNWEVDKLCGDVKVCTTAQKYKYAQRVGGIARRLRRIFGSKKSHVFEQQGSGYFDADMLKLDNVYFEGYWQTEKYFKDVRKDILESIKFPEFKSKETADYAQQIKDTDNSVSIHIRRGDYLKFKFVYGNIPESGYYEDAIEYMRKELGNPKFYVFSDDIEWCRNRFESISNIVYVEHREESPSYEDMQLMSMCKSHIIANSSFSWWGAWLDDKHAGITVAPKQWLASKATPDICPDDWIRL